jgi:hypothetical protein
LADPNEDGANKGHVVTKVDHVVEQRVSNLAQGILTLGAMTGPLLAVLHLIPQGVLAGLFFVMGVQALEGNGITLKILFLCKDKSLTPASEPLKRIHRRFAIWVFVAIQLIGFGATFAITQTYVHPHFNSSSSPQAEAYLSTFLNVQVHFRDSNMLTRLPSSSIAAVGFPIIILLLIPFRTFALPKWFTDEELRLLDAPTASPFTMISVGGNHGEDLEEDFNVGTGQRSGEETVVPSGSEGMLVGNDGDSDEGAAERGEGSGAGMNRRESWKAEGRSGRWGESFEMQKPGMSRRSVSRQSK